MYNEIIKKYGIFVLIYILFIWIMIKFNFNKQAFMISLLIAGYLYYINYYSSIPELINNTKLSFNDIINNNNNNIVTNSSHSINNSSHNENNRNYDYVETNQYNSKLDTLPIVNKSVEREVIKGMPTMHKLTVIKQEIDAFIDTYIPEISREVLQVKQENNRSVAKLRIDILINNYIGLCNVILKNDREELNYYQQIKSCEKEILTIIHNTIFLNHKSDNAAGELIAKLREIFAEINTELSNKVNSRSTHHQKDYIPTNNDIKPANNYEAGILF